MIDQLQSPQYMMPLLTNVIDVYYLSFEKMREKTKRAKRIVVNSLDRTIIWLLFRQLIYSRLFILIIQFIANELIPDHNADAFRSIARTDNQSPIDRVFGGLARWDAVHFLHIAQFGYTYENNLAFAPLYPFALRYLTLIWWWPFASSTIQLYSALLVTGAIVNALMFVGAGLLLYRLTIIHTNCERTAIIVVHLFALNPASIFFSAVYSESLFSLLTWLGLYLLYSDSTPPKGSIEAAFCFALALLTRSNGLLNCLFIAFALIYGQLIEPLQNHRHRSVELYRRVIASQLFRLVLLALLTAFVVLLPSCYYMHRIYVEFCIQSSASLTDEIRSLADAQKYVLPGQLDRLDWCRWMIPNFYASVQERYWQVHFLGYWQWKKLPCFLLALPALCLSTMTAIQPTSLDRKSTLPYVVQLVLLTTFGLFYINVEVCTRLIFASSPLIYWSIVDRMHLPSTVDVHNKGLLDIYRILWQCDDGQRRVFRRLIVVYFVGYSILGACMHANFLPWT